MHWICIQETLKQLRETEGEKDHPETETIAGMRTRSDRKVGEWEGWSIRITELTFNSETRIPEFIGGNTQPKMILQVD